jgi:hypothetical protein
MSNQSENENQQSETVTPEEVRQYLLAEIEAGKQAITELSDEQLEEVAGGGRFGRGGGARPAPGEGMRVPGTGSGGGSGSMLKQAALWTVGGTIASYGISMLGSMFGGGQSSSQGGGQSSGQGSSQGGGQQ